MESGKILEELNDIVFRMPIGTNKEMSSAFQQISLIEHLIQSVNFNRKKFFEKLQCDLLLIMARW